MKKRIIGILTFVTAASAGVFALTQGALTPTETPAHIENGISPTVPAASGQCFYNWATKGLPDISAEFQAAAQAVIPEVKAYAIAYGEDCVYADGSATFGAMETDFYISIPAPDLADDETLGTFIEQILSIVDEFARPRVPGPQDGFVEFTFQSGTEQRIVRIPILLGKQLREQGLRGANLIHAIINR